MTPYEVLGVGSTATEHQIKTAYRLKAKETHPDTGADGTEFREVTQAYALLMDPERRKRFDETGEVDGRVEALTIHQRMIQIIAGMFNEAIAFEKNQGKRIKNVDVIAGMRHNLAANLSGAREHLRALVDAVADRKELLGRITRPDDGENVFAEIIKAMLVDLERNMRETKMSVTALEMAVEEMKHYKSEVELVQAMQMGLYGGNFGRANTSANNVFTWG